MSLRRPLENVIRPAAVRFYAIRPAPLHIRLHSPHTAFIRSREAWVRAGPIGFWSLRCEPTMGRKVMRTNATLAGLALMLGLAAPVPAVAAEPPDMSPAADEAAGAGGSRPGMQGGRHHGGWQRNMQRGHSHGHHRPSFIGMLLRNQQQLGLTAQQ